MSRCVKWCTTALLSLLCLCISAQTLFAQSADYPRGPIRILVGFPPGGATDLAARALAEGLNRKWSVQVVVENKPGANGVIAIEEVRRAAPDGQVLHATATGTMVMLPHVSRLSFDPRKDLTPITLLSLYSFVFVSASSMPFINMKELLAWAKQNPTQASHATTGNGSSSHFAFELLKQSTATEMTAVPYKGDGVILPDLAAARITVALMPVQTAKPLIDAGRVKALAVSGARRVADLPNVPTIAESGFPELEIKPWVSLVGPAGMPNELVQKINAAANEVMLSSAARTRLTSLLSELVPMTAADTRQHLSREYDRWGEVARKANIHAD